MKENEYEELLKAVRRIERKLDIVIRAIYEHDEGITDDYGRSQRSIDAGRQQQESIGDGELLGDVPRGDEPNLKESTNPPRSHGEVQREEPIPGGRSENKNIPRKNGRKHWKNK